MVGEVPNDPSIMKKRVFTALVSGLMLLLPSPLKAAEKDPFAAKFGGPYKEGVSEQFRKDLLEYGSELRAVVSALGPAGLKDKEGFKDFSKEVIDPALAKLEPKTDAEKKLKAAAVQVKMAFAFVADPAALPEGERKEMEGFLKASVMPGAPEDEANRIMGLLLRFPGYAMGMDFESYQKLLKRIKEAEE
jgi:hypothetical protein